MKNKKQLALKSLFYGLCLSVTATGCLKKDLQPIDEKAGLKSEAQLTLSGKTRKVLVIGIDGCLWKVFSQTNSPNIQNLINTGYFASNTLNENPTVSGPNWATILTGTVVAKHNVLDNGFGGNALNTYPSFFNAIKTASPARRTASFVSWASINDYIVKTADATLKTLSVDLSGKTSNNSGYDDPQLDANTKTNVVNELTNNNPDVIFSHFDNMDHTGHSTGFSTSNAAYVSAIQVIDAHVGNIITALHNRANYANEDWLIVLTTDHGGVGTSHGGTSYTERNSFIILNNTAISPTLVNTLPTTNIQTTPNSVSTLGFASNIYGKVPTLSGFGLAASNSFTIEFRVKATSATSDPVIIGNKNWASGYNKGIIIANRNGKIRANFGDGTNRLDLDGVDLTDQNWHYVSIVVNRTTQTATMYDAGVQVSQASISAVGDLESSLNFYLGQDATTNYSPYFNGNIAGLRLFNAALSASTINSNVFQDVTSSHPNYANLKYYAKGKDGSGMQYAGSFGSAATTILVKNSATASWSTVNTPIYLGSSTDYHNAPHTYDIAATVLNFLGIAKPTGYDGSTLISF